MQPAALQQRSAACYSAAPRRAPRRALKLAQAGSRSAGGRPSGLLIEVDGALTDIHMDGHRQAFNRCSPGRARPRPVAPCRWRAPSPPLLCQPAQPAQPAQHHAVPRLLLIGAAHLPHLHPGPSRAWGSSAPAGRRTCTPICCARAMARARAWSRSSSTPWAGPPSCPQRVRRRQSRGRARRRRLRGDGRAAAGRARPRAAGPPAVDAACLPALLRAEQEVFVAKVMATKQEELGQMLGEGALPLRAGGHWRRGSAGAAARAGPVRWRQLQRGREEQAGRSVQRGAQPAPSLPCRGPRRRERGGQGRAGGWRGRGLAG
jgi:hypothetical protein